MAIMITGGTGFLGSYLTRHLIREKGISGKDLVLFDRYPSRERIGDVLDQVNLVTGDITEPIELAAAVKQYNVDQIYHLAAILGDPAPGQVVSYMKVMCDGTLNVFETARVMGVKRVVYASSVAVYGRASFRGKKSGDELDEDDPPSPGTFYGMCKAIRGKPRGSLQPPFRPGDGRSAADLSLWDGTGCAGFVCERPASATGRSLHGSPGAGGLGQAGADAAGRYRIRLDLRSRRGRSLVPCDEHA